MINLAVNNCALYMGTNAGSAIYTDIERARRNVMILSPHVSEDYVDLLLKKHAEGVNVMLITSTDFEGKSGSKTIYKKLITQSKNINEQKKRNRLIGLISMYILIVLAFAAGVAGYFLQNNLLYWPLISIPVAVVVILALNELKIFEYEYIANMPFYVMASPNADPRTSNQIFVNARIFIIDDVIAYLGSPGFTRNSFQHQYESVFKIEDVGVVSYIYRDINGIISDQNRLFRDINFIGRHIYPEPVN